MTLRVRLALVVIVGLLAAGSIALIVNAIAFQDATYKNPTQLSDALLAELHVPRSVAEAYVRQHPESAFQTDTATKTSTGISVDSAFQRVQRRLQADAVNRSRWWTAVAIGVLALVASVIGWLLAGRALRPIRLITSRAQSASASDLTARVNLPGPAGELKDLADTFDEMLGRLEQSFIAQRSFTAHVSHELRTPIAIAQSEADNLLADTPTSAARQSAENIRRATMRADRTVAALLALGRAESGGIDHNRLALDVLVGDSLAEILEGATWNDIRVDLDLHPTIVDGDAALIDCIVRNLLDNAARHNTADGWVKVRVDPDTALPEPARAVLEITNTTAHTTDVTAGHGIGLTVVAAAVAAHGGTLEHDTRVAGTYVTRVWLPIAESPRAGTNTRKSRLPAV